MTIDPIQHARRWKTLGVLSLSLVIIGLDNTILNVALPTLQDEFNASPSKLQWMVDSYLLVFAGLLLVFGTLGDRFGRKLALQAGVSIFGLASLGALVADSADQVIVVRAAMGIGAALIMPATLSIIANVFTGEERGKAIAIWAALAAVGIGLGPLAGGLLLEWFSWPSVFLVNVPFAVAALVLGIRYVPESRDPRPGSFDLLGAALSAAGFSILVYAIIEAPEQGWTSGLVLGSLTASIALLGAFVWWEGRTKDPMLDLGFFRSARFSVGTGAVSVAFFALLGAIFALTQYLQFAHGFSAIEAGAIMSPIALGLMMGAGSSSKAVHRLGTSRVVAAGLSGLAVLLAVTTLWDPSTNALLLAGWFFGLALAMGWVMAPATEAVIGAVPAAKSGVASATNTVARMVSGALGVAVIGSLVSSLYSTDVEGSLDGLPPEAQAAAESSVGAASAIAAQLPSRASSEMLATTGNAFTQAMGTGLLIAAALAGAMAIVVIRFLPARESVEANVADSDLHRVAGTRKPSVRRKAGVWMILAALVLATAYLASKPGSDTPAANGPASAPKFAAIERFVQGEMAAQRIPGLALGIVENGRITYLRGFGKADDSGRAVTPKTPFIIGSLSKSFTALAIMQLVEAGEVELDAPVQRYLPWFHVADEAASAEITVRHLLNHTSGLSTKTGRSFQGNGDTSDAALEKTVRKLSGAALTAPVGKTYQYSTVNYAVLGLIVQTVAGRPYESYVQTEILDPLQMHGSFTSAAAAEHHGLATGYRYWFGRPRASDIPYNRGLVPAGYLISDAEDMSHYLIAQLNRGRYGSTSVLSPEGVDELHRPAVQTPETGTSYGMGWFVGPINGIPAIHHQGETFNFHSNVVLVPGSRTGVIVLMNAENSVDLFLTGRMGTISEGVTSLLEGRDPASTPSGIASLIVYLLLFAIVVLQLRSIARWVTALRHGRVPRGRIGPRVRIALALALSLGWAVLVLVLVPKQLGLPLLVVAQGLPDLAYLLLLSGVVALCWGIVRSIWAYATLRRARHRTHVAARAGTTRVAASQS
jgi:EmrB/QacA subfamily drug resistance transporter